MQVVDVPDHHAPPFGRGRDALGVGPAGWEGEAELQPEPVKSGKSGSYIKIDRKYLIRPTIKPTMRPQNAPGSLVLDQKMASK